MNGPRGDNQALDSATVRGSVALSAKGENISLRDSLVGLSVRGENVSLRDSLVGLVVGPELSCQDSVIVVANAQTLSGDTTVLVEGRSLVLAAAAGAVLFAIALGFLRRRR